MQAIVVKRLPYTNTRPSRYKATCASGSLVRPCGHFCDTNDVIDRRLLAEHMRDSFGWKGTLHRGQLPNGDDVFVFENRE
jgi:hypothetical protein